jgi:hypothetical protein
VESNGSRYQPLPTRPGKTIREILAEYPYLRFSCESSYPCLLRAKAGCLRPTLIRFVRS